MIIRPAVASDKEQLADILNGVIAIGGTTAYQTPVAPEYFDSLIDNPDPKTFLHVAEKDGQLEGMQWMRPMDPDDMTLGEMGGIATFARPGTAQKGIGTALFQTTFAASVAAGYAVLDATIRADNTGGLAYYAKMGFQDHAVTKEVPLADGTEVDRVHKRLKLDPSH